MKRSDIEACHRELNDLIGRTQTPEQFEASIQERMRKLEPKSETRKNHPRNAMKELISKLTP